MIDNQELIEKATITTDAMAAAGKLTPAQTKKFIDYIYDATVLKGHVRFERFTNEELWVEKIGIGKRVAVPKAEAVAPNILREVSHARITIKPLEIMVPFEISDRYRRLNIEGEAVDDHIIRMMTDQLANNVEELWLQGDELGPAVKESDIKEGGSSDYVKDPFLAMNDGWIRMADAGHVVDWNNASFSADLFSKMINAMPDKFKRDYGRMRFFASPRIVQNYRLLLSKKETGLGDEALTGTVAPTVFGIPIVSVPLLPDRPTIVEHVTLSGTTPVNLRYGWIENVTVLPHDLGSTPTAPYVEGTDYTLDATAGTIARIATGAISDGATVKVTYTSLAQIILTLDRNFIVGIAQDVRIEKDRDIYRTVNQYAITVTSACECEETDALVKAINVPLD